MCVHYMEGATYLEDGMYVRACVLRGGLYVP